MKAEHSLTPDTHAHNSKGIEDLNIRPDAYKSQRIIGRTLFDRNHSCSSLDPSPGIMEIERK